MAANPEKFQMIFIGIEQGQKLSLEIDGISVRTTEEVKLLGTTSQKVEAFSRIAGYLQKHKIYVLYKTFIRSTFNYSPLIWEFCGRTANNGIKHVAQARLKSSPERLYGYI